ncbi:Concanavalin A-like lectin/glucanase subgroup [Penicillium chrysogenum]|nr:Concanavalin A-like lectin/glucanase subgroup [Penicillium chrysogenum]
MDFKRKQTDQAIFKNCDNVTSGNSGCGVIGDENSYGEAMNNRGLSVYALELRNAGIRAWFFPSGTIPDITAGYPDPSGWGIALADFPSTHFDIATHFKNLGIIVRRPVWALLLVILAVSLMLIGSLKCFNVYCAY